jgi:hypothetical protein
MSLCPLCNGFATFQNTCSKCSGEMKDAGKVYDLYSDYSPYRPTDDLKMTNGYDDFQNQKCMHFTYCATCGNEAIIGIEEITQ